ncbi:adenosylcobinamide-GDP ribazoletransferase [Jannaschia sp. W003]|nr:adenosylcobinamide-GDP ribazoletransferase [Jannaschia sp. W003]UWQ22517.1 adenosylcobinamide-GDP ribazoletransferase [Jannaschia sp. W003]
MSATENDIPAQLRSAALLLTRIPVRGPVAAPAARAAWAWPLVGLAVGAAVAGTLFGTAALGAVPGLAAALALLVGAMLTGALHEDGLADVADGIWGGGTPERRLAIMRDSRLGTYGALALGLGLLARWSLLVAALAGNYWLAPVAAAAASRAAMAWMLARPPARADGLGRGAGRPGPRTVATALALGALPLLAFGLHGLAAALLAALATLALARLARARIGGVTGDVCGAAQQLAEIAVLAALLAR